MALPRHPTKKRQKNKTTDPNVVEGSRWIRRLSVWRWVTPTRLPCCSPAAKGPKTPPAGRVLYHRAEAGSGATAAVRGSVLVHGGVRSHQHGAAVYGVLPLLGRRWQRRRWEGRHGAGVVGNAGVQTVHHGGAHLTRHHGDTAVSWTHRECRVRSYRFRCNTRPFLQSSGKKPLATPSIA